MCSGEWSTFGLPLPAFFGILLFSINISDLPGACNFPDSISFADDANPVQGKNQAELFLLNQFSETFPQVLTVKKLALNTAKTQAINILKNKQGRFI